MSEKEAKDKKAETAAADASTAAEATKNTTGLSVEELQQALADEQKKSAEHMENWQRSRADFLNLKRRTEQERATLSAEAKEKLLMRLLPAVDDFERAMATLPEGLKSEPWIGGVSMIEKKLKSLLATEGVTEIPAQDHDFDPRVHEAVKHDEDSTGDKEVVTEVYQKGYKLGDKVIRPAMVVVGKK